MARRTRGSLARDRSITGKSKQANGLNGKVLNAIILGLPRKEREAVTSKWEAVNLPTHIVLAEQETESQFAYFLNSGLASILTVMHNGKTVEVGLTGQDGFVGTQLLAGLTNSPNRIVMQVGGDGFRIETREMVKAIDRCPILEKSLLQCAQELTMQATQVAACNRLHSVDKRLARWLLMSQDRIGGNIVPLTQQYLAHMLGTRRASVTVAASMLQRANLISYNRGVVTINNRKKLEAASCECYRMIKRQSKHWQNEAKN